MICVAADVERTFSGCATVQIGHLKCSLVCVRAVKGGYISQQWTCRSDGSLPV